MNYKGKKVKIKLYKFGRSGKLRKVIIGKCIKSHQSRGIMDSAYYNVRDSKDKIHYVGYSANDSNFSIEVLN